MSGASADEPWKTFARAAGDVDPSATVTHRGYVVALGEAKTHPLSPTEAADLERAAVAAGAGRASSLSLPHITIDDEGSPPSRPADLAARGVLGEGGMGRVLVAVQRSLARDVAVKVLKPDVKSKHAAEALFHEGIVTGSLEHPNIVPVHALGRDDHDRPVLVMKRIEGVSWRALVEDPAHPHWPRVVAASDDAKGEAIHPERLDAHLEIFAAVCNAVHFAHSRGIVHRDLKLDNVMIGGFGEVYVVDWGIAASVPQPVGARGGTVGTPSYMAPEMVVGDLSKLEARTDVYLLGATLHAAITGRSRHQGDSMFAVLYAARASIPFEYGPGVPEALASICNKATSAAQADRYASALELRRAVVDYQRHKGSNALAAEAERRLGVAVDLIGRENRTAEEEIRLHHESTAARFGFVEAQKAWPGNERARAGLDRCLAVMIEHAVARKDLGGARSLLEERSAVDPKIVAIVEALARELDDAEGRAARLDALERDQDLRVGGNAQLAVFAVMPAIAAFAAVHFLADQHRPTTLEIIGLPALVLGLTATFAIASRKRVKSAIGRRALALVVLFPTAGLVHRLIALALGVPLSPMLAVDLVLGAVVVAALALTALPLAALSVVPLLAGASAIVFYPAAPLPFFAAALVSSIWILFFVWRRAVRTV